MTIALSGLAVVPARADHEVFAATHTAPSEAFAEVDLELTATIQSTCHIIHSNQWFERQCDPVELTAYYVMPTGISTSVTVTGEREVEFQDLTVVIPARDIEVGVFSYSLEASQTYCIFLGCTNPNHSEWGRIRIPENGDEDVPVPGMFPTAPTDDFNGIDIDSALMKINFQECGPRAGGGICTTADSRPVKYFSGDFRGALRYACQGTVETLSGDAFAGACVYDSEDNSQGSKDSTAKTRTNMPSSGCDTWVLRAGDLIGAGMDAEFVHTIPSLVSQVGFDVSELFLNVVRPSGGPDVWTIRSPATDPGFPGAWSYFIGWDQRNGNRYVKMYLSGQVSSSSPTAVCANGDHIAELILDIAGAGLLYTT